MNQIFDPDYKRDRIINPFEELFSDLIDPQKISPKDFMVRVDVCIAMAAYTHSRVANTMASMCEKVFPEIIWTDALSQRAFRFARECRLGLKIMSDNEEMSGIQKLKAIASVGVLVDLAKEKAPTYLEEMKKRVCVAGADVINNMHTYTMRVYEVAGELFGENADILSLNEQTYAILCDNYQMLTNLFETIHASEHKLHSQTQYDRSSYTENKITDSTNMSSTPVSAGASYGQIKTSARDRAVRYANTVCLLEACIVTGNPKKIPVENLFAEQWRSVFGAPATNLDDVLALTAIVQNDQYLQAMEKLLHYSVRELKNDTLLRRIVVARCVHRALSVVPKETDAGAVFDEALDLYSGINVISIGKEEGDIKHYLNNYILSDGAIDGRAIEIFREHKKEISSSLDATRQGIAESKTRNRYVDNVFDEKDRQIAGLQEKLDNSQFSSLFKLADALTNRDYGYLLSRIYRVANGYDELTSEKMIGMYVDLLQILRMFGIMPTHENSLGATVIDESEKETKIAYDGMTGYKTKGIVFPGWRVKDDIVSLPVSTVEQPSEDD